MSRIIRRSAVAALAVIAAACAEPGAPLEPDLDTLEPGGEPVAVTRMNQHPPDYAAIGQAERFVVDEPAQWEEVWGRLWNHHQPRPAAPAVDFGRELVIVAAMGWRATGGHSIRVDQARSYADHVTVHVRETAPGRGCVVTQATTAPVDVVKIPRTALEVRFRTTAVVRDCG